MDAQTYAAMMSLLQSIDSKVDDLSSQQECMVTRLEKAEQNISKLWLAIFGAGPLVITGIAYLYVLHLSAGPK